MKLQDAILNLKRAKDVLDEILLHERTSRLFEAKPEIAYHLTKWCFRKRGNCRRLQVFLEERAAADELLLAIRRSIEAASSRHYYSLILEADSRWRILQRRCELATDYLNEVDQFLTQYSPRNCREATILAKFGLGFGSADQQIITTTPNELTEEWCWAYKPRPLSLGYENEDHRLRRLRTINWTSSEEEVEQ